MSSPIAEGETIVAQYLVTRVTWWATYPRVIVIGSSSISTYNPDDFACTNRWDLAEIDNVELSSEKDQFIIRLEKSTLRAPKFRFRCRSRGHLMSLVHKLRRHFTFQPIRFSLSEHKRHHYRCVEYFADDSHVDYMMQIGVGGLTLLDDVGRKVETFPFVYLRQVLASSAHPDGVVLVSRAQDRLFLFRNRPECLQQIGAAAKAVGVDVVFGSSPLNVQLLRLRNSQLLDKSSIVCFEVDKAGTEQAVSFTHAQLILQTNHIVEVHPKLRRVISRPYSSLLYIIRSEWDAQTVVLEFLEEEHVVVRVAAREQLIALLLLVCHEAGHNKIELLAERVQSERLYRPHFSERADVVVEDVAMETFFLRRIVQSQVHRVEQALVTEHGTPAKNRERANTVSQWQRRRKERRRGSHYYIEESNPTEPDDLMNDHLSTRTAIEELNANVRLDGLSDHCNKQLLNKAIEVLGQHLLSLIDEQQHIIDPEHNEIVITLQALVRLCRTPYAFLSDPMIPRVFDALHEILDRRVFLSSYWCLKLLQSFFEPRKSDLIRIQKVKALQYFIEEIDLMADVVQLLPKSVSAAPVSAGHWVRNEHNTTNISSHNNEDNDDDNVSGPASFYHSDSTDSTFVFQPKDDSERVAKDISIVAFEAIHTVYHAIVYLNKLEQEKEDLDARYFFFHGSLSAQRRHRAARSNSTGSNPRLRDDGALERLRMSLTEKLLVKHQLLMASVVDMRLRRSCKASVAVIKFAVKTASSSITQIKSMMSFRDDQSTGSRDETSSEKMLLLLDSDPFASSTSSHRSTGGGIRLTSPSNNFARRVTVPGRRPSLEERTSTSREQPKLTPEAQQQRVMELRKFLDNYYRDVDRLDARARVFHAERTQVVTVDENDDVDPATFFTSALHDKDTALTLEHLTDAPDRTELLLKANLMPRPRAQSSSSSQAVSQKVTLLDWYKSEQPTVETVTTHDFDRTSRSAPPSSSVPTSSDATSSSMPSTSDPTSSDPTSSDPTSSTTVSSNYPPKTDSFLSAEPEIRALTRRLSRATSKPAGLSRSMLSPGCDACICCNDVCEDKDCVFCADKEFQLLRTFSDSMGRTSVSTEVLARRHGVRRDSSVASFQVERKYSSCEVKRHRSKRSCWVIVHGVVYDVTDLLPAHPGGADAILQLAKQGKDCGAYLQRHPAPARRVLEGYRLGEYYTCEKRTIPTHRPT
ncbi:TPA: hypothetical protein N0F65_012044 [Lagenidium giganteum]|uniref:Cytochrome b5 heme-binding domain-containing protein n=1 Tax=Lagenidium giganteum TaxID=4803 RepID=A0AAV2YT98_9STRA|nr:TPA: hypothetical protein N0F65_012044 [Lagenidium giganteum]